MLFIIMASQCFTYKIGAYVPTSFLKNSQNEYTDKILQMESTTEQDLVSCNSYIFIDSEESYGQLVNALFFSRTSTMKLGVSCY